MEKKLSLKEEIEKEAQNIEQEIANVSGVEENDLDIKLLEKIKDYVKNKPGNP